MEHRWGERTEAHKPWGVWLLTLLHCGGRGGWETVWARCRRCPVPVVSCDGNTLQLVIWHGFRVSVGFGHFWGFWPTHLGMVLENL